ncbi:MAG: class I SAM-dependent methyltransferase, partial [Bryobacteraceae bacterium]
MLKGEGMDPAGMRAEWNERAREDAYYFVSFGRRHQSDEEFFATADDVVRDLETAIARIGPGDRRVRRALEIGCGPGRLMLPMSWNFGEMHGVDVSEEMIRLAMGHLHDIPSAFPRLTGGVDLAVYPDGFFDFVFSYAVFQHIPDRNVVLGYLAEAARVMRPGGILRCQINGLPEMENHPRAATTWDGARISVGEIAEFAGTHDMQLLALEGIGTQYMWTTIRKKPAGWFATLADIAPQAKDML